LADQATAQDAAVLAQFTSAIGPFSPYWRGRLGALGVRASSVDSVAALRRLPAVAERDVCPGGDPAGAAALVLQVDEAGWALHTSGPELRRGLGARLRGRDGAAAYRRQVEAATRPTTYQFGGVGMVLPIASTRRDLDLTARAGARLWSVLGLGAADVLVSAVPVEQRLAHVALSYAALGAGAPGLFPGDDPLAVAETLRMVPATVLAVPADGAGGAGSAGNAVADLLEVADVPESVATVLLVGGPTDSDRADVAGLLPGRRVLGVWGPPDGRVLYGESRAGEGYVTYPDLEVLDVVDPDTGAAVRRGEGGELVLTQLGFRGSALVRWRTGTLLEAPIGTGPAPDGRTVPRLPSDLVPDGLVPLVELRGRLRPVDLRAVSGALAARTDLVAFRVDLEPDRARGAGEQAERLVVRVAVLAGRDSRAAVDGAAAAVRSAAGVRPDRVLAEPGLLS